MFRSLRTQLLLWTILPLAVILVAVAYLGVSSHQSAMRDLVEERDGGLARVTATGISQSISSRIAILSTLDASRPEMWNAQQAQIDGGIAAFDAHGNIFSAIPSREIWEARRAVLPNISVPRDFFAATVRENNATLIVIAVRQSDKMLAGAFTLSPFTNIGIGARGAAYLVDASGKIIAHPDAARLGEDLSRHEGIAEVIRGETGATFHHAADGSELVVGYAPISQTGWGLIVEEPWADVVAPMFQYSILLPLVLLLVAIGALGAIYFGIRNVIRPLQNLTHAANRIAFGDYSAAEKQVGGVREVEDLRETLNAMAQQVRAAQNAMQSYIAAITRGQEDERLRLARELHDDTIQSLIALQQRIEMVEKAVGRDPVAASAKVAELKTLLTNTLGSVRRFVRDLRPTYLEDLGLIPALETLSHEANAQFEVVGEEKRLDAERELALYRIVQEALRNTQKHSHAHNVSVKLTFDSDEVTAAIEDNGAGFDAPESPNTYARAGHFGLMGMQERAQLFGGKVYVKSERDKGTRVIAFVPIK